MSSEPFAHLHTHSEYSLLDGAARVRELAARAKELGQSALAVTDHGVLAGAIEFYEAATEVGIRPIIGCEVYVAARSHLQKEGRADRDPSHLILLASDQQGYANLVKLVSRAHLEGFYYKPRIDHQLLAEHAGGLVALSGCIGGEVPQRLLAGDAQGARAIAEEYREMLGPDRYFLEIQDHGMEEEGVVREGLIEIARQTEIPLVATNDCHYVDRDDAEAHDVLLCIQTGSRLDEPKRLRFAGPHFYLSSEEEMEAKFDYCLEAVRNSGEIASRCRFEPSLDQRLLPTYDVAEGEDADGLLETVATEGLRRRCRGQEPPEEYRRRLAYELSVIRETGFAAYFLIVWDFTRAGREEGVKIGPGRGSSAGSLVAYSLGITDIDPLQYGLIFERFLNPERVSMPDIDIDFDVAGRARVIDYVNRRYGSDRVAQIVTYGTMAARAAVRDVGRVLSVPLPQVDQLAKLIPVRVGMTLDSALAESRELKALYDTEPWVRPLIDTARRLEGICRNAGTHAGGVVIAPGPLTDYVPLQRATTNREAVVTQFDMDGVQKIGLLKMDFLGLENLTILEETLDNIERVRGERPELDAIPLDDAASYELVGRGDTLGVFQLEQPGGRRIAMEMKPRSIADLAAAVALNRPGVIEGGATDLYMKRRRGEEPITYILPELEPILKETQGVIVYQDQVMQIAAAAAGFSLGAADLLRAAMGKKDKAKMAAQRARFIAGAVARDVPEKTAEELFDYIDYFAGYGFNKAHSVAYGLITYQTAYFKAHYPLEFMAALLNSKASDFERLKRAIQDAQARGILVHPPDVNRSQAAFSVFQGRDPESPAPAGAGEILYGLQHVKNVGEAAARAVVAAREEGGPFRSLVDLCSRVRGRELNRRALDALIRSGACDRFGDRGLSLTQLESAMRRAEVEARVRESGQTLLFESDPAEPPASDPAPDGAPPAAVLELTPEMQRERLAWEREHLGIYLSDHPLQRLSQELERRTDTAVAELPRLEGSLVQVGGSVRECRRVQSRKGDAMAFAQLEDLTGICEVVVFPSIYQRASELLHADGVIVVRGRVEVGTRRPNPGANGSQPSASTWESEEGTAEGTVAEEPEEARVIADEVLALDDPALEGWRAAAVVHIRADRGGEQGLRRLAEVLDRHRGQARVVLHLHDQSGDHELELDREYAATAAPALEAEVVGLFGEGSYRLEPLRAAAPPPRFRGKGR